MKPCLVPFLAIAFAPAVLAQITPGNLVVTRVGTGAAVLSSAATEVFLEEYTTGGTFVQSIPLPTAASIPNQACTAAGSATSEGYLSQSADGRYLIAVGYGATPGTLNMPASASATVNRVIARIDLNGVIDTSTALTDAHSAGNIRSAVSYDGNQFWTAGSNQGVRYAAGLGATTSTLLTTGLPTNVRVLNIYNEQLYVSSSSGAFQGPCTLGTGLPTASGQVTTVLPGFPAMPTASRYDYFFADASTLYVANDANTALGGLEKWSLIAGTWTLQYTLQAAVSTGCRSVTGVVSGGAVTLYATTSASLPQLVSGVDLGVGSPFVVLATSAINTAIRGVQFVRTPSSLTYTGTSCPTTVGIPTVGTAGGLPVAGNSAFQITAGNGPIGTIALFVVSYSAPLPFGFPLGGAPACALLYVFPDVIGIELALAGTAAMAAPIPNDYALAGFTAGAQVLMFDALLPDAFQVGTSNALQIGVGN